MREASFSSPVIKATIEQSLNSAPSNSNSIGLGFRPTTAPPGQSLYLNPRLQQRGEEVKRVVDILLRRKKRNSILVGESEPEAAIKEVLRKIERKELGERAFGNAQVIHLEELPSDREQIPARLKELGVRVGNSGSVSVFVNLGDLKCPIGVGGLSNNVQVQQLTLAEMGRLVGKFGEGGAGKLWLLGIATCETYLRCQVYHPSMENDWDLQTVPISRTPLPGMFLK